MEKYKINTQTSTSNIPSGRTVNAAMRYVNKH